MTIWPALLPGYAQHCRRRLEDKWYRCWLVLCSRSLFTTLTGLLTSPLWSALPESAKIRPFREKELSAQLLPEHLKSNLLLTRNLPTFDSLFDIVGKLLLVAGRSGGLMASAWLST